MSNETFIQRLTRIFAAKVSRSQFVDLTADIARDAIAPIDASVTISSGQAIHTSSEGRAAPATTSLRHRPFAGVAKQAAAESATTKLHTSGPLDRAVKNLGAGVACAVGVDSSGHLVRATDPTCSSAPNWIGFCDTDGTITVAPVNRGHFDPFDFGAVGDNATDDLAAFQAMLDAMPEGSTALVQPAPGGAYLLNGSLNIDKCIDFGGRNMLLTVLQFAAAGQQMAVRRSVISGASTDGQGSKIHDIAISGVYQAISEWQSSHSYNIGDRVRSKLHALDSNGGVLEVDAGVHFRCTQAGMSGGSDPNWDREAGETTVDGGAHWVTEDWSGLSITTALVKVSRVKITGSTDSGIYNFGNTSHATIADGNLIEQCFVYGGDGHGIYFEGGDANACATLGNTCQAFARGAIIYDSGFLSNSHNGNNGAGCRRAYVGDGTASGTVWNSNYAEADCGPSLIVTPHVWIGGQPAAGFSTLTSCLRIDSGKFVEGVSTIAKDGSFSSTWGGQGSNLRTMKTPADIYGMAMPFVRSDAADPDGGGYWTERACSQPLESPEEQLTEQSLYGAYRKRFPIGFFLGKIGASLSSLQIRICACRRAPTSVDSAETGTLLFQKGDVVFNTNAGDLATAPGWIAAANGGWGGGRFHGGRTWTSGGTVCVGEGIEPTTPNGKVFRLLRFEQLVGMVWTRYDSLYGQGLSTMEPTWDPVDGHTTIEDIDATHRIVWECWGDVGMTWTEMPTPTTQVTT